jgi:hypothetical protein
MKRFLFAALALSGVLPGSAAACDLCAIYGAANARGEFGSGFVFSASGQFTPFRATQLNGEKINSPNQDYLDRSITHLVAGYNFTPRIGLSLNVPFQYSAFQRTDYRYSLTAPPVLSTQQGSESGLGDVALVTRWTVLRKIKMEYSLVVDLLGGAQLPTGNTSWIRDEVQQAEIFQSFLPPGTPHDPLSHSVATIHEDMLSPGSGSYDGVFGATVNSHWDRWLLNSQFQYYLRTPGESGFQFGDEIIVSGGPGAYLLLKDSCTLSLQANATYDTIGRDSLLNTDSDRTGSTAWYMGPRLALTVGRHFSANLAVDLPLRIANNTLQSVPNYVFHAGLAWRF